MIEVPIATRLINLYQIFPPFCWFAWAKIALKCCSIESTIWLFSSLISCFGFQVCFVFISCFVRNWIVNRFVLSRWKWSTTPYSNEEEKINIKLRLSQRGTPSQPQNQPNYQSDMICPSPIPHSLHIQSLSLIPAPYLQSHAATCPVL